MISVMVAALFLGVMNCFGQNINPTVPKNDDKTVNDLVKTVEVQVKNLVTTQNEEDGEKAFSKAASIIDEKTMAAAKGDLKQYGQLLNKTWLVFNDRTKKLVPELMKMKELKSDNDYEKVLRYMDAATAKELLRLTTAERIMKILPSKEEFEATTKRDRAIDILLKGQPSTQKK